MSEIAESASPRGMKISIISFISSTSEAAKPMTAGQEKYYVHEIIIVTQKEQKELRGGR